MILSSHDFVDLPSWTCSFLQLFAGTCDNLQDSFSPTNYTSDFGRLSLWHFVFPLNPQRQSLNRFVAHPSATRSAFVADKTSVKPRL
jgi:hypothetical protein